jgi:hypothetical protein
VTAMTTLSVRQIAEQNLGRTGDLSINTDVFGYRHRDNDGRVFGHLGDEDVLPGSGTVEAPTRRSLRRQLETVSGPGVDLVLFLVGHEPDWSGSVTPAQAARLQYAAQVARDIWAQKGFGLRRLEWGHLTPELAGNRVFISTIFEGIQLTHKISGRPGAIDVFAVQGMASLAGRSPKPGPCDKTTLLNMNGCLISLESSGQYLGIAIAHEVGHYLGLGHETDQRNLMHGPVWFAEVDTTTEMLELTDAQVATMKEHCMVVQG